MNPLHRVIICTSFCALLAFALPAQAGHCDFMLYSEFLGRSLKTCQTAETVEQCGVWPTSGQTNRVMALAEGKELELLEWVEGGCSEDRVVGTCLLATGSMVFYEGEPRDLATGCNAMQGTWQLVTPEEPEVN